MGVIKKKLSRSSWRRPVDLFSKKTPTRNSHRIIRTLHTETNDKLYLSPQQFVRIYKKITVLFITPMSLILRKDTFLFFVKATVRHKLKAALISRHQYHPAKTKAKISRKVTRKQPASATEAAKASFPHRAVSGWARECFLRHAIIYITKASGRFLAVLIRVHSITRATCEGFQNG